MKEQAIEKLAQIIADATVAGDLSSKSLAKTLYKLGYVKLAEAQNIGDYISFYLGKHGQMKLYDDYPDNFNLIMKKIEQDMLKAGWRKVEL